MIIKFKKLHPDAIIPAYQTDGSSGFDLHALEDAEIWALEKPVLIRTGLAVEAPGSIRLPLNSSTHFVMPVFFTIDFEIQVRPRSGLSLQKGIIIVNSPGTIDADYRGEIMVGMRFIPYLDPDYNHDKIEMFYNYTTDKVDIHKGDRIAQGIVAPIVRPRIIETWTLSTTKRADNGFGSTGMR
jgi:dUTP pyrophosphatase